MKTPSRPADPFTGAKPRPAESVKGHETTPEEIRRTAPGRPAKAVPERPAPQPAPREAPPQPPEKARALHLVGVVGLSYAKAAKAVKRPLATVFGWCKREGVRPGSLREKAPEKCDGNHAGPICASGEGCWQSDPPPEPTLEAAAADLGLPLPPEVADFGRAFEALAQRGPLREVPGDPAQTAVDQIVAAAGFHPDHAPRVLRPASPESTARGEQLEVPEVPAPRHVEVYVGPPRGAEIARLDAAIVAALAALREGIKGSDWACVRVAAAILNETGGAS